LATKAITVGDLMVSAGESHDFSLVLGGPLYQLLRRTHLTGDALELVRQRTLCIVALAWLPLLVLSAFDGQALGGRSAVPFLKDVEAHVRLLVALPLLIVAELVVHTRMRRVVQQFLDRHLIPERAIPRFEAATASAVRLRNSIFVELALLAAVYVVGVLILWRHYIALSNTATWYALPAADGIRLSPTGLWYASVSLPIFQFLLLRWYYRIFIWVRFLWQVARIDLRLIPTHPDRAGGLGFLADVAFAFTPLVVAHGALVAGTIANRIFYAGAALPDFKMEIVGVVLFLVALVLGPFVVFAPQLAFAKRTGLREYGTLAERYVREFDDKWLRGGADPLEPFVGSADIQSLADLGNSFELVTSMRVAPISRDALVRVAAGALIPIVPLALTMMPLDQLLKKLLGVLL
jgi:hypothetical protein